MSVFDVRYGTRLAKVAVIINSTALLFAIVAFFSTYWRSSGKIHEGLWRRCMDNKCFAFYSSDTFSAKVSAGVNDWFQAAQVLILIGFVFSLGTSMMGVLYACVPSVSSKTTAKFTWVTSLFTGLLLLVGLVVFSKKAENKYDLDLSWSFGLEIVACVLHWIGTCALIFESRRQRDVTEINEN